MATNWKPVFTAAGLMAARAAHAQGLSLKIAHIALGDAVYEVRDGAGVPTDAARAMTALKSEKARVPVGPLSTSSPYQVAVQGQLDGAAPSFWVGEVGFILDTGELLAVWSNLAGLGFRNGDIPWLFRFVLSWSDLPAQSITVVMPEGDAAVTSLSTDLERLRGKVHHTVEVGGGLEWSDTDNTQLTAAIGHMADARIDVVTALFDAEIDALRAKVRHTVEAAGGLPWADGDATQLTAAIAHIVPMATEAVAGKVKLATPAETLEGSVKDKAVTPFDLRGVLDLQNAGGALYTTVGTHSWTVPAGVTKVRVTVIGPGGGSGAAGAHTTVSGGGGIASWGGGGGGGGGGGRATKTISVTPGAAIPVTVGAPGQPGIFVNGSYGANASGTNGGTSSFGSFVSATGGLAGGGGYSSWQSSGAGGSAGAGGSGIGGDLNVAGTAGAVGSAASTVSGSSASHGAGGLGGAGQQISGTSYGTGGAGPTTSEMDGHAGTGGAVLIEWGPSV